MPKNDLYTPGLVSVVIPSFNRAQYLGQAIDSVLNQTHTNIELFVVDDGSTDDSVAVARSYGLKLTILAHPNGENRGQSASINLGLDAANGEYIAILDSDDYWMLDKLAKQVDFFKKHYEIGVVYGNALIVDENGGNACYRYQENYKDPGSSEALLLDCYFSIPGNALVRHTVYDAVGRFDESLRAAQDHDMAIRLSEVTKFAYIGDVMFSYRRHGDSISAGSTAQRWTNGFHILQKAKLRYPYSRRTIKRRLAVLHFRTAQCLLADRHRFRAVTHLAQSFMYDPGRSISVLLGKEQISSPNC